MGDFARVVEDTTVKSTGSEVNKIADRMIFLTRIERDRSIPVDNRDKAWSERRGIETVLRALARSESGYDKRFAGAVYDRYYKNV